MGEWADYYVERMIERHINPERIWEREWKESKLKRDQRLRKKSDKELIKLAKETIRQGKHNESYFVLGSRIIEQYDGKRKLSEKQRKVLYGLVSKINI